MNGNCLQAYINLIHVDHRELGRRLQTLRTALHHGALRGWTKDATDPLVSGFGDLYESLKAHMAREEEGGCLEEALAHAPQFHDRVGEIMAEHPRLLRQVQTVLELAKAAKTNRNAWAEVDRHGRAVIRELLRHEAAENKVLGQAFDVDLEEVNE